MENVKCEKYRCIAMLDPFDAELHAGLCPKHFALRLGWARMQRGQNNKARDFYEKYWRPEDYKEPEPTLIDENGREVTVKSYINGIYRSTRPHASKNTDS